MRKRNALSGFTLIELLVVISIISILAIGISNINFTRLSQRQQVNIGATQIVNLIEEARNNALIGKGVDSNLTTPDSWSVIIDDANNRMQLGYEIAGVNSNYSSWSSQAPFSITDIECRKLDDSAENITETLILTFTGSQGGITGCSDDSYKKIDITYGNPVFSKNIIVNTLSGIIEVD